MPEPIEPTETPKEDGQQVDLNTDAVRAHVQQAVTAAVEAAVKDKTRIAGELKTEKTAVVAERDAYSQHGTAEQVAAAFKRLAEIDLAEQARTAKSTPDAFKAEMEKQVAIKATQHETRMGEIYSKQKDEAAAAVQRAEGAEKSAFRSFVLARMLQAAIPAETLLFRAGATKPLLDLILPYAKEAPPLAEGLDPELIFEVGGVVLSGSTEGQQHMGFRELLGLLRKPHKDGLGVLPQEACYYFHDNGSATDSQAPDGDTGSIFDWGKATLDEQTAWAKGKNREQRRAAINASRVAA